MNNLMKYKNIVYLQMISIFLLNICFYLALFGVDVKMDMDKILQVNLVYLIISLPLSIFLSNRFYPELLKEKSIIKLFFKSMNNSSKLLNMFLILVFLERIYRVIENPTLKNFSNKLILPGALILLMIVMLTTFGAHYWKKKA